MWCLECNCQPQMIHMPSTSRMRSWSHGADGIPFDAYLSELFWDLFAFHFCETTRHTTLLKNHWSVRIPAGFGIIQDRVTLARAYGTPVETNRTTTSVRIHAVRGYCYGFGFMLVRMGSDSSRTWVRLHVRTGSDSSRTGIRRHVHMDDLLRQIARQVMVVYALTPTGQSPKSDASRNPNLVLVNFTSVSLSSNSCPFEELTRFLSCHFDKLHHKLRISGSVGPLTPTRQSPEPDAFRNRDLVNVTLCWYPTSRSRTRRTWYLVAIAILVPLIMEQGLGWVSFSVSYPRRKDMNMRLCASNESQEISDELGLYISRFLDTTLVHTDPNDDYLEALCCSLQACCSHLKGIWGTSMLARLRVCTYIWLVEGWWNASTSRRQDGECDDMCACQWITFIRICEVRFTCNSLYCFYIIYLNTRLLLSLVYHTRKDRKSVV